jgi:hypothetical protein
MVMQVTGDGDNLIEYGELWAVTIAIKNLKDLKPKEVFRHRAKAPNGLSPESREETIDRARSSNGPHLNPKINIFIYFLFFVHRN